MFVWIFHRVSGLVLIVLLGVQMATGALMLTKKSPNAAEAARKLHSNSFWISLLALLIIMHAVYGLRTMLYDLGVRNERALFWVCTACGLALAALYLCFFLALK